MAENVVRQVAAEEYVYTATERTKAFQCFVRQSLLDKVHQKLEANAKKDRAPNTMLEVIENGMVEFVQTGLKANKSNIRKLEDYVYKKETREGDCQVRMREDIFNAANEIRERLTDLSDGKVRWTWVYVVERILTDFVGR